MKYRKKPVVIDAITFDELDEIARFVESGDSFLYAAYYVDDDECVGVNVHKITRESDTCYLIPTLEGAMLLTRGDMLITGVNGEIYPCKPDIFAKTYDPAE